MPLEAEKRAKFRKGFAFNVVMLNNIYAGITMQSFYRP